MMLRGLVEWAIKKGLASLDGVAQRGLAKGNRAQTIGGLAGGAAILGLIDYAETELHCDLSLIKFGAAWPVIQGWLATGGYFHFDQMPTAGDEEHARQGGNAV